MLIPWSISIFNFTPLGLNGLVASRALCHEESALHSLLVSELKKGVFTELPKSLIVPDTSPSAFHLGQAGV